MASKFSNKLAQAIAGDQPWDAVLRGGKFLLFSGTVPSTAEESISASQYVMSLTKDDAAWTAMTGASMTVTITAISPTNTIHISVGGIYIHALYTATSSDTSAEATALALSINKSAFNMGVRASANTNIVTLFAPYGTGTLFNGAVVANGGVGGTISLSGNFASGADGANGVTWERDETTLNKIIKPPADIWKGTCPGTVTTAVALTFFRYILDSGDTGYSDDSVNKNYRRWQGTIGGNTSTTADLKFPISSTNVADGVILSISSFEYTIPLS